MCRIRKYIFFVSLSGHSKYRYADIEMSDKYMKLYNHTYDIFSVSYYFVLEPYAIVIPFLYLLDFTESPCSG